VLCTLPLDGPLSRVELSPEPKTRVPSWENQTKKEVINMKYEKPEIVCVDDAAKSIQQMQKDVIAQDHSNGTLRPPAFQADE
jgi:hypothetical protein